ncbi:DUF6891 domain-containing protein [Zavarzinella formosa]|uniref:DUF6891 domain-containing protein n=1 Tax=Zavarzinella formosa TaxID=360055 RepID=UPI0002DABED8|nr:hypothetical protein [Zavarzinella formosa]
MDNKAIAREAIHRHVWSGFPDEDEIFEIISESHFWQNEIDPGWLRREIAEGFRLKQAEEASWPEVSDCDRLDAVFGALHDDGILALHNAGYTQSDGTSDVAEFYHEDGGEESGIDGYCFYHGQDLEGVIETGDLFLTFGDIDGDDARGVEVGRRIKGEFESAGFVVEWDGSIKTRLLVKGIKWRRRGRPDNSQ